MNTENLSVQQIRQLIDDTNPEGYEEIIPKLESDARSGVRKLASTLKNRLEKNKKETDRLSRMKSTELSLYAEGFKYVAGVDEAGRGPLCGPVVSAVVIMPEDSMIPFVNDSKKLTEKKREELYERITAEAVCWAVGIEDHHVIDEINILQATRKSVVSAIGSMDIKPDMLLTDDLHIDYPVRQKAFVKGDANIYCIAAASIIAKVTRDRMMYEYDRQYPEYGFASNKGYGTEEHINAIRKYGPTPIHRLTFIKNFMPHEDASENRVRLDANEMCCSYLRNKGYEVLETRYVRETSKIDVIAKKDGIVSFVKIFITDSPEEGDEDRCVKECEESGIRKTADRYTFDKGIFDDISCDIMLILHSESTGKNYIKHIKNAY